MSEPTRPILRYHGGKWKLAPWIVGHFPPHRIYVESFGGGGSVLMRKPRSYAEVYNDKWPVVVDVFRCVRNPDTAAELERQLRLTPFARDEFFSAYIVEGDDLVERARKSIIRSFMGFGSASTNGEHLTGFRGNSNRSGTTPAHDWVNWPDCIKAFTERLQGVVIENLDFAELISRHDSTDTLIYADPPYTHDTRNMARGNSAYAHDFTTEDHERLAAVLHESPGMVIVSGYPNPLYDRLFAGWEVRECRAFADGAQPRREMLWLNGAAARAQSQQRMFA
jgi:DNA adenine methylase